MQITQHVVMLLLNAVSKLLCNVVAQWSNASESLFIGGFVAPEEGAA